MSSTRLIKPSRRLEMSHRSLIREFTERGEERVPWVLAEVGDDFEEYVTRLEQHSNGVDLPQGFVPSTTFGVRPSARRKGHATEILRRTLIEARELGIDDVLITCDKDNLGSVKAIVSNSGELWDERYMTEHSCTLQRYWIRRSG